jgi:RNA polymerase sigma factor (sigma-70 family)
MSSAVTFTMGKKEKERTIAGVISGYGKKLSSFIRNKVRSLEEAEDILQDVWYQFSNLTNIDELESISGWLFSVARNKITDLYRKKRTDNLEDFIYEDEEGDLRIREVLLLDDSGNPELTLFKEYFWKALFSALDELPENQRKVFIMNEIEDVTLQEIADREGANLKTIISRKGYAVQHLRKRLLPIYQELNLS